MLRKTLLSALMILGLCAGGFAASEPKPSVGVVNFTSCMSDSKLGKHEQTSFDALKNQMSSLLEDTEKQTNEIAAKFNDSEYMDGLSPEAEEEMKNKFRTLNEEIGRYQNQYYQVLQQANMKVMQTVGANIQEASEKVAKDKKLNMVMSKEACFFAAPTLDVTNLVVAEMDRMFEQNDAKTEKVKK
ncbi:MAG: hypothetical protein K1000chlam3_00265 [Chlamydiae bacterium]|nr:hypothetical protein [Chlamydiota bacterium]